MGSFYDSGGFSAFSNYGNDVTGAESVPRDFVSNTGSGSMTSQTLRLSYFTAKPGAPTVTKIVSATAGTAAGATPTLCRMGLYSIASDGAGTLVASCANDTALWNAINTEFERALASPSSYTLVPGQRYAWGALCVTAAAVPILMAAGGSALNATTLARSPKLAGFIATQTDLPASFTGASVSNSAVRLWGAVAP